MPLFAVDVCGPLMKCNIARTAGEKPLTKVFATRMTAWLTIDCVDTKLS